MFGSLIDRFAVNRSGAGLLLVGFIDATGTGLYLAGSALFFTKIVGLSPAQVGFGLSLAGILGILGPIPFGRLADRWGPRPVLMLLHACCAVGFAAYFFVDGLVSFLCVVGLLGIAEQAARPMGQALVELAVGTDRRAEMAARMRVVYNVGYTVGALLAAVALQIGTRTSFLTIMLGDALSFALSATLLAFLKFRPHVRARRTGTGPRLLFPAIRDHWYAAAAGVNALLMLHMALLSVGVPLWITLHTRAPDSLVAVLLVVNTVLAVLFQVRVARGTEKVTEGARALRRASVVLALCCACFATAAYAESTALTIGVLLVAMVLLTGGELLQSAGQWSLSFGLAPTRSRVEYLATFHLGSSVQVAVGPVLMTVGVIGNGTAGWAALAAVFLLAGLCVRPVVSAAARRPHLRDETPDEDGTPGEDGTSDEPELGVRSQ
ncbi:MFS transporter [Streptomyces sp. enrichment culture]|uniref:MFS transporter n=1 Tax=Streptomyces sp. enrichment culture TaxID=1795815 RepID=UPI003F56944C